jgi:hypothetical protein
MLGVGLLEADMRCRVSLHHQGTKKHQGSPRNKEISRNGTMKQWEIINAQSGIRMALRAEEAIVSLFHCVRNFLLGEAWCFLVASW